MFCDNCGKTFEGVSVCPECGAALTDKLHLEWGKSLPGELTEIWPKDEEGQFVAPAFLCHCTGFDMDDVMTMNLLQAYGIPSLQQYPGDGAFGKLILGMSGNGVDIYVPETMRGDAAELLKGMPEDEHESI